MKTVLKFTRIGLLFLSVIAMAFVAGVILFPHHNRPPPKIVDDPFSSMLWIVIPAVWMSGPFWFGYLIVRRKTADMPSIGLAVGLILPYLYYLLFRPRGGISAVMTILSIPILAIVSGLCLAGLVCLARLVSRNSSS